MTADRHPESSTSSSSVPERALDPSPEFDDAFLNHFNQPPAGGRAFVTTDDAGEPSPNLAASAYEHDPNVAAQRRPHESVGRRRRALALETHIDGFPEARAETLPPLTESSETWREQDRGADTAALREARRREAQVRTELQALQTKLTNVTLRHNDAIAALKSATQRATQARAELVTAMTVISARDVTIDQLHRIDSARDREIAELQRRMLEAEEARMTDAAAFLESLDQHRT